MTLPFFSTCAVGLRCQSLTWLSAQTPNPTPLVQTLPQLTPKTTVEFLCKLGEPQVTIPKLATLRMESTLMPQRHPSPTKTHCTQYSSHPITNQVQDIELSNPSRKLISYAARLEGGGGDFSIEGAGVKVEAGGGARLTVRWVGRLRACMHAWAMWLLARVDSHLQSPKRYRQSTKQVHPHHRAPPGRPARPAA
jgi:hypothetical protein